jgi:hypothetical protein
MAFKNYDIWINNRFNVIINAINNQFGDNFLKNKSILELGAGYGDFGYKFYELGMNVTCIEGRNENLEILQKKHPYFISFLGDMDKEVIKEKYDVILHCGLLYHMKNIEKNLENCLQNCDIFILETENIDSTEDSDDIVMVLENGSSKCAASSLLNSDCTDYSSRTTRKYLEKIFQKNNFKFLLLNSSDSNTSDYIYDWKVTNSKKMYALRSIYIAYK